MVATQGSFSKNNYVAGEYSDKYIILLWDALRLLSFQCKATLGRSFCQEWQIVALYCQGRKASL